MRNARRVPGAALERVKGIEPSYEAWEAAVLPLNYTRSGANSNAASGVTGVLLCCDGDFMQCFEGAEEAAATFARIRASPVQRNISRPGRLRSGISKQLTRVKRHCAAHVRQCAHNNST
jgi:hypothetical protein